MVIALFPILSLPAHLLPTAHPSLQWDLPFWLQLCHRELAWGMAIAATACVFGFGRNGIEACKRTLPDRSIQKVAPPAILFMAGGFHATAHLGMTNGLAEVWDPASGKRFLRPDHLRRMWEGQALECRRGRPPSI